MIEIGDGGGALRVHEPGVLDPSALGTTPLRGLLLAHVATDDQRLKAARARVRGPQLSRLLDRLATEPDRDLVDAKLALAYHY